MRNCIVRIADPLRQIRPNHRNPYGKESEVDSPRKPHYFLQGKIHTRAES